MSPVENQRNAWLADHVLPHEPALRAWLRSRFSAQVEVDDIVQETWSVLAALADVSHVQNPRAYLFTVARSVIFQQLRRARIVKIESMAEIDKLGIDATQACPEQHATSHEALRQTGEMITDLPTRCRQAFMLRKIEGLSQREIARRMSISESTVEKHLSRALRLLMQAMSEQAGPAGGAEQHKQHHRNARRHD